jgi:hypothetical protein
VRSPLSAGKLIQRAEHRTTLPFTGLSLVLALALGLALLAVGSGVRRGARAS